MLILASTSDLVRVVTDATADVEVHASWADLASGTVTPGRTNTASITTATTTTVVASPASSTQRNVNHLNIRNNHASTSVGVVVDHTDGTNAETLVKATLLPGEALVLGEDGAWMHYDVNASPYPQYSVLQGSSVMMNPAFATANLTGTKTITSGSSFAVYIGKAPKDLTSIVARYRVTTAAATITWAELALAKGQINVGGNPTLTVVGYADVAAVINSTGQKSTTINVSSGQVVRAGDDLWLIIGNSATTAAQVRAQSIADDIQVGVQGSVASRPSTIVGAGTAFTIEGATTLAAWIAGVVT